MKEFRNTDEITKEDLEKMYNAIVKFDNYISSATMNNPNKVKAKLIVEVEGEFYDDESSEETLRYCVEQDLEDAGLNVIDVSVMK